MQRTGDPWQSWDAGRVWAALACWQCCLANGHVPLSCNPDELPAAIGAPSVSTDANLDATAMRADIERAIGLLRGAEARSTRPRTAEYDALIRALCALGPPTKGTLIHPADEVLVRSVRNARPREVGWVEYETIVWDRVAQRQGWQDWEEARRRARTMCVSLAVHLGFRGQYRWE